MEWEWQISIGRDRNKKDKQLELTACMLAPTTMNNIYPWVMVAFTVRNKSRSGNSRTFLLLIRSQVHKNLIKTVRIIK